MRYIPSRFVAMLLFCFLLNDCSYSERNKRVGNTIVSMIEEYYCVNDSLPNSLRDLGQEEVIDGVLFCYEKNDSAHYMIWFGTYLGEGLYYYSDTKQWEDRLRGVGHDYH